MYHVYVLRSVPSGRLYKGQAQDVARAVEMHNQGQFAATSHGAPWELVHQEHFASRVEANRRERYLKTIEGSHALKQQLGLEEAVSGAARPEPG